MRDPRRPRVTAVLLAVILTVPVNLRAQETAKTEYYISNELGMALEKIGWYRREEFPYILIVRIEDTLETRTLLHQGEELQRWEYEPEEERVYRGSVLDQRKRYDQRSRLIEEQLYSDGVLTQRTLYHYQHDVLERTETFSADGSLLYRDYYRISADGQLRRVTREEGERRERQRLGLGDGTRGVSEERYGNNRERRINRYDQSGRLVEREYWAEGELVERERIRYLDEEDTRLSSQLEEPLSGRTTWSSYDAAGRIIRVEVTERGVQIERTDHRRDSRGRIVETTRRGSRGIENWLFEYGPEEELQREEYRVRGSLERITLYSPAEEQPLRVEELYREGELFMKVHYRAEEKEREEFFRDGELVRVREYQ